MVHIEPGKLGKQGILPKSQGEPGIVREFFIILIQVREKSEKTTYLVSISLSLALCMVVCRVVVLFLSVNVNFRSLHCYNKYLYCLSIKLYFVYQFCRYVKWGQGKSGCF